MKRKWAHAPPILRDVVITLKASGWGSKRAALALGMDVATVNEIWDSVRDGLEESTAEAGAHAAAVLKSLDEAEPKVAAEPYERIPKPKKHHRVVDRCGDCGEAPCVCLVEEPAGEAPEGNVEPSSEAEERLAAKKLLKLKARDLKLRRACYLPKREEEGDDET